MMQLAQGIFWAGVIVGPWFVIGTLVGWRRERVSPLRREFWN